MPSYNVGLAAEFAAPFGNRPEFPIVSKAFSEIADLGDRVITCLIDNIC